MAASTASLLLLCGFGSFLSATGFRKQFNRQEVLATEDSSSNASAGCDTDEHQRRDCGHFGIDEHGCTSQGCCWRPAGHGVPWCYQSTGASPAPAGNCQMSDHARQDCGWYGVDQHGCEAKGCCWAAAQTDGAPWCFKPGTGPAPQPQPVGPSPRPAPGNIPELGIDLPAGSPKGHSMAFVHLFEWKWDDIAKECEDFLGPKGYSAVQVSPPNEHIQGDAWWTRYQPVSYKLLSRSGDEASFISMIKRCKAVGVGIYFDGVINHMAGGEGTGSGGSQYSNRNMPIFSPQDFHHDQGNQLMNCGVDNYNDKHNVQYCDLVGLPDLCTGCPYVQETIAAYINRLIQLGVAGFRIDAAKHIDAGELAGILNKVDSRAFRFLEVIGHGNEAVTPSMYYHLGSITEFNWNIKLGDNIRNHGSFQYLESFGESWGLMPHNNAVIFVDNHDTQRGHAGEAALTHKSGPIYTLANIFMLAHPYGYPKVMSSYHFGASDQGPPHKPVYESGGMNCGYGKEWTCEHRWPAIANMVAWRNSAGESWITSWHTHGPDQVAFCRGGAACIAFNRMEHGHWDAHIKVEVPAGEYCNVIKSDEADCPTIWVQQDGTAHVNVEPMSAVAFHIGARKGQQTQPPAPSPAPTPAPVIVTPTPQPPTPTHSPATPAPPPARHYPQGPTPASAEVYVMLSLTTVTNDGRLGDKGHLNYELDKLREANADGFMVDVWWGITERQPKVYDFSAYEELVSMAEQKGLKVQLVSSFHQCGGNVGDDCFIPLPSFATQKQDIWFKDQHGAETQEYISFFADDVAIDGGRTPIDMYSDWFQALAKTFASKLGNTITEIQVGLGPCGELRYPAYPLDRGWEFCGVGEFQAFDKYALANLSAAGGSRGWTSPPTNAGSYNSRPWDTEFFNTGYKSEYGKFFLDWYLGTMKSHAARVLQGANAAFQGRVALASKVAGIHWWYGHESHAAEVTAGYYNTDNRNAYWEIADTFASNGAALDFTCLEMRNREQSSDCKSMPEDLVGQVRDAAHGHNIHWNGENALPRYDWTAYEQILQNKGALFAFTYLRANGQLFGDGFGAFKGFVDQMHRS